jgi:lipid-binding SYLF domain-containing protein
MWLILGGAFIVSGGLFALGVLVGGSILNEREDRRDLYASEGLDKPVLRRGYN